MPRVKIYYYCLGQMTTKEFCRISLLTKVKIEDLNKYYLCLYTFETDDTINNTVEYLENLFKKFNSNENPLSNEEYQTKIKESKCHTSMSTGDVIQIDDDFYVVGGTGFKKIN